ncbi:hypothetical protein EJ02DRAFT_514428 [Clathrospora elynae]|uniref:DUF7730 domain-containing protein n=1 Tax=Clathrospora elynae TaxID=706981 RepID=A0A6A5SFP2_9PLEO|nr:hypothetical protein EJ02DRAFT_514428 [Clathrospora elynae]
MNLVLLLHPRESSRCTVKETMKFRSTSMKEYSLSRQRRDFENALPSPPVNKHPHAQIPSQYKTQHQSSLLSRLPGEVRFLIWTYALGNQKFHIIPKYRRFGHAVCDADYWQQWNTERPSLQASSWMYTYGSLPTTKKLADYNICDLLVACSQM